MTSTRLSLVLVALALLGVVAPVGAAPGTVLGPADAGTPTVDAATATNATNETNVSVRTGAQLATVLTATEISTRTEVEAARFELELERGDEAERAAAIAERAETLAERAEAIREDYEDATAAREAGEISAEAYARRLAELNARAEHLLAAVDALRAHARNVSTLELRAAGLNRSALRAAVDDLDPLTGVGPTAILQRFLGESTGELELETGDGLRVEVEGEDGERALEVRRPRDEDPAITEPQDAALETARGALPPGEWSLDRASVHTDSGYYRFEFERRTANETGEAEVRVDGSSGEVFRLEVEIEGPDSDGDADDRDGDATEEGEEDDEHDGDGPALTLLLVDGTPAPNASITVRAMDDGEPAANVTVAVDGHAVAETDAHGEATLRLPRAREVEVRAGDGELEFEFDGVDDGYESVYHHFTATASLADGEATVRVAFDGEPVEGATVAANDHLVGETDADGSVTFAFDPAEEDDLDVEVEKGAFAAEFEFVVHDGGLVLTESAHEVDDEIATTDDSSSSGSGDDHETPEPTDTPEPTETPEPEADDGSDHGSGDGEETETETEH